MTLAAHDYHRSVIYRRVSMFPIVFFSTLGICLVLLLHPLISLVRLDEKSSKSAKRYMDYIVAASILDAFMLAGLLSSLVVLEVYMQKRWRKIYEREMPKEEENAPLRTEEQVVLDEQSSGPSDREAFVFGRYLVTSGVFVSRIPGHTAHPMVSHYGLATRAKESDYNFGTKWWSLFAATSTAEYEKIEWSFRPRPLKLIDWRITLVIPAVATVLLLALIICSVWLNLLPTFTTVPFLLLLVVFYYSLQGIVRALTMHYVVTNKRIAVAYRDILFGYTMDFLYYSDIAEMSWNTECSCLSVKLRHDLEESINNKYSMMMMTTLSGDGVTRTNSYKCFNAMDIDSACKLEDVISKRLPVASVV